MLTFSSFILCVSIVISLAKFYIKGLWHKYNPAYERPLVQLKPGTVQGLTQTLPNGAPYHFFKGIPYAQPAVGGLRFRPPVPVERFKSSTINCSIEGSQCTQINFITNLVHGSEDGLNLNVFTPELPHEKNRSPNLPVMVWIHGGGFQDGSGDSFFFNPLSILQERVVVVTFNYRLGPLGFLCLPSVGIYGNMGLKDQVLVFKWVQQNITRFGGNPDNVTLFGQSAGSICAQIHYLSPKSRQYFHRIIGHSCTGFTEPHYQIDPPAKARKLASLLGCTDMTDKAVYETLMNAPARLLVKFQTEVGSEAEDAHSYKFHFRPVVEHESSEESVITESPEQIIKKYDTLTMPMITGGNSGEGLLSLHLLRNRLGEVEAHPDRLISLLFEDATIDDRVELGRQIKSFYFADRNIDSSSLNQLCEVLTDIDFLAHLVVASEWISKYQPRVKHYHYRFSFDGRHAVAKALLGLDNISGVCHGDEMFYLFEPYFIPEQPANDDELKIKKTIVKLWTNFAKYGEPTMDGLESCKSTWLPVKSNPNSFQLDCLQIDTELNMICNPYGNRVDFWRNLLLQYKKDFL